MKKSLLIVCIVLLGSIVVSVGCLEHNEKNRFIGSWRVTALTGSTQESVIIFTFHENNSLEVQFVLPGHTYSDWEYYFILDNNQIKLVIDGEPEIFMYNFINDYHLELTNQMQIYLEKIR